VVSQSGYYSWMKRKPSRHSGKEARLEMEILAAHKRTRETFGPECLQSDLAEHGVLAGIFRIRKIRKSSELSASRRESSKRQPIPTINCQLLRIFWSRILKRQFPIRYGFLI